MRLWRAGGIDGAVGMVMHPDQLTVSLQTARELVVAQFLWWVGLPVREVASQGQ